MRQTNLRTEKGPLILPDWKPREDDPLAPLYEHPGIRDILLKAHQASLPPLPVLLVAVAHYAARSPHWVFLPDLGEQQWDMSARTRSPLNTYVVITAASGTSKSRTLQAVRRWFPRDKEFIGRDGWPLAETEVPVQQQSVVSTPNNPAALIDSFVEKMDCVHPETGNKYTIYKQVSFNSLLQFDEFNTLAHKNDSAGELRTMLRQAWDDGELRRDLSKIGKSEGTRPAVYEPRVGVVVAGTFNRYREAFPDAGVGDIGRYLHATLDFSYNDPTLTTESIPTPEFKRWQDYDGLGLKTASRHDHRWKSVDTYSETPVFVIDVDDVIRAELEDAAEKRRLEPINPVEIAKANEDNTHIELVRLRLAAIFAWMRGRPGYVDRIDWRLAQVIIGEHIKSRELIDEVSDAVETAQREAEARNSARASEAHTKIGLAQVEAAVYAKKAADEAVDITREVMRDQDGDDWATIVLEKIQKMIRNKAYYYNELSKGTRTGGKAAFESALLTKLREKDNDELGGYAG